MQKTLADLLEHLEYEILTGSPALPISALTNDSRQVKPGSVFLAIPGYSVDGHCYVPEAVKAGAAAVVVQHPEPGIPVPQIVVRDTRRAQAALAAEFYNHPSRELNLIGVTGTNGKTTSTFMIDAILQAAGLRTGLMGTLYNKNNGKILPTVNTTPDSILVQRLLREMAAAGVSHVSMEVSSHAMVMHRVGGTYFAVGAITNFSPDHMDLHRDMKEYLGAKKSFFDMLPESSYAIVNLDDPGCCRIAADTKATTLYYSLTNPKADLYLAKAQRRGSGTVVNAKINTPNVPTSAPEIYYYLGVSGEHNIANSLLAVLTALITGLDIPVIAKGLGGFRGIFRRCEVIYNGSYKVIDDATHNPANMEAVFQAVSAENPAGLSIVYAIRGSRGVEVNRSIAATLRRWTRSVKPAHLVITRCSDTAGPLDQVKPEEEQAVRAELEGLDTDIHFTETLRQAVSYAINNIDRGETLLLMGAHPMDNVSELFSELAGVKTTTLPRPPRFGVH